MDMTSPAARYEKVASIIGGYGRELPEWDELRDKDRAALAGTLSDPAPGDGSAPSTVTVATPYGPQAITADLWDRRPDDSLIVSLGGTKVAEYAKDGWHGVLRDASRAVPGPGHPASADALGAALQKVLGAVADTTLTRDQRLAEVQAIAAKALRAHTPR